MSVLHGHSFCSSPPQRPMISDFEGFLYQILSITLFSYLNSWERASTYFPFQCWVLNKGTTGTIFITSLVWRGPWLGIEPGTSRTRSQHSTTRLSRGGSLTFVERGLSLNTIQRMHSHCQEFCGNHTIVPFWRFLIFVLLFWWLWHRSNV